MQGGRRRWCCGCFVDAVAEVPDGPVGHADRPVQTGVGAHALLGLAEQVDRGEPLPERQVRVMHDGAGLHAEAVAASDAVPLASALDSGLRPCLRIGGTRHRWGQRRASRCCRQVSSLAKRSSRVMRFMSQAPTKHHHHQYRLRNVEVEDVKLAEKVFGKRSKKELDKLAEAAGRKGVRSSIHEFTGVDLRETLASR